MSDLEINDRIETNDSAREHPRPEVMLGEPLPAGKTTHYTAGEKGTITAIDYDNRKPYLVHIRFDDGGYDVLYAEDVTLIYRPINDPALYERTLLDLIEAQS